MSIEEIKIEDDDITQLGKKTASSFDDIKIEKGPYSYAELDRTKEPDDLKFVMQFLQRQINNLKYRLQVVQRDIKPKVGQVNNYNSRRRNNDRRNNDCQQDEKGCGSNGNKKGVISGEL